MSARGRAWLALLAVPLLADCGRPAGGAKVRRVILVTCDTLRADRLRAYGGDGSACPNLDAFAEDALVYREAYSSSSITVPALSSLHSGLLPDELGVETGNQTLMRPRVVTLAERLADAGLATAAVVSNWVVRAQPGMQDAGLQQGFDHYDDVMSSVEATRGLPERLGPDTTDAALAWLETREGQDADRFFLWVHYQDPHGPYTPPESLLSGEDVEQLDASERLELGENNSGHGQLPAYQALGGERRVAAYRARYDAEVQFFDRSLGALFDELKRRGWWEDSLIVFSADHGESLGEKQYWFCHGEHLGAELVRVPLIVRAPSSGGGGRVGSRDDPVSHLDLVPTICEALGLEPGAGRGRSLFAPPESDRVLVQQRGGRGAGDRHLGLRRGDWRLLVPADGVAQLYDVVRDPTESRDLARSEPERATELARALQELVDGLERPRAPLWRRSSPRAEAALRALGYGGDERD